MRFQDRHHAGQLLAEQLLDYAGQDGVVYALPRGGVPLGVEIGLALNMPVELAITRKIGHPVNPEYAICAVSEGGQLVCNEREREAVPADWLARRVHEETAEAARRRTEYRDGAYSPPTGKLAILVDDGIATGLTMLAAVRELKAQHPGKLVVAVPVAPPEAAERFRREADDFVAVDVPAWYLGAVGAYYRDFHQLSDDDVRTELAAFAQARATGTQRPWAS